MENMLIKDKLVINIDSIANISTDDDFDDAGLNDDSNVDLDDDDDDNDNDNDDDDDDDDDDDEGERNNIDDGFVEVNLNVPCLENRTFDDSFDDAYICNVPDASSAPHTLEDNHLPLPHASPSDHCNERSHVSSTPSSNATSIDEDVFCVGQYFVDKKELKMKVHMLAIRQNFEFKVKKSNKKLVVLVCVDPNCKWRIRATKTCATGLFVIRKHCNEHTCSLEMRQNHHRQATCSIIAEHLKARYEGVKKGPNPAQIVNERNKNLGVKCSYWKAWKARKCAHELIRGSAANSYPKLPSYLYMVQKSNLDGNFQIYPLAFGIVDSENDASWNWFLTCLRDQVPDTTDLVFISDRHKSIIKGVRNVYKNAYHGACMWHLGQNIKTKFSGKGLKKLFEKTAKAYRVSEFTKLFAEISTKKPSLATYLKNASFESWSRCHFHGNRYNIMTTNNSESLNQVFREAREWPIIPLLEEIITTLSRWFYERRTNANSCPTPLTVDVEDIMRQRYEQSRYMRVTPINISEFHVKGEPLDGLVNIEEHSCTCREFDIDKIPCIHGITAAMHRGVDVYSLCSKFYTTEFWRMAYAESIYPLPPEIEWLIPEEVKSQVVIKPIKLIPPGRPKNKRIPSRGEFPKEKSNSAPESSSKKVKGKVSDVDGGKSNGSVPIVDVMGTTKPHARSDYISIYFGLGLMC
ncbi:uncharacterized protein LOC133791437 [Humulus lupulus]|uniref:uncharacterized protein LOC133791437 n=1 Tax=Humulus lupulus TaxID=3486 RepID=UPI002B40FF18|nr:uncharacterized protein LOC133791437 [Humulus lupulus]